MNSNKASQRISHLLLAIVFIFTLVVLPGSSNPIRTQSYIVQAADASQAAHLVEQYGGVVTSQLSIIRSVGANLSAQSLAGLQADAAITSIFPNATVETADDGGDGPYSPETDYPDVVGADVVWDSGVNGSGVTVAVVDTGFAMHRGIRRNVNGKILGRVIGWKDFVEDKKLPRDPNGHGTHVTGIIANSQLGDDDEWNGIAPGVKLVGVRVLDENGEGSYERVIQGIQWVVDHKDQYNIRVMNLSLVALPQSPYWADPLNQAVTNAWANGIVVVVAAGNGGPDAMSVGVPGNNPYVITVGAFTDNFTPLDWNDDYVAPFSAAGPTLDGFVKPDLVAPGAHMVSTMLPWSYLARNHDANRITNQYFSMAGTSLSSAAVSGIAALVLSQNPALTPNEVKYRLMAASFPWIDIDTTEALYSMWQQGAGRASAPDAVFTDVTGEANAGMDIWGDLAGSVHYEGYSYYDETTGQFRLRGDFDAWEGGYGVWSGGWGVWSGGWGVWSGGYGVWSGGYGVWSGGYGVWSGGYGVWSGGYGVWSGGYGVWSGGYGVWSGGYGVWSGSEPWAGTAYAEAAFVDDFLAGVSPDATSTSASAGDWVEEP